MTAAHLHLILNHLPIIGIPISFFVLLYGLMTREKKIVSLALVMTALFAICSIPVYLSGEPAEEIVKTLPGMCEELIEAHEDAAGGAFALTDWESALKASSIPVEWDWSAAKMREVIGVISNQGAMTSANRRSGPLDVGFRPLAFRSR